jgi:hypothetical protein
MENKDNWWLAEPLERRGVGNKFKIGDFISWNGGCGRVVNYTLNWPAKNSNVRQHYYIINWKVVPDLPEDWNNLPGIWQEDRLKGATPNHALEALYGNSR